MELAPKDKQGADLPPLPGQVRKAKWAIVGLGELSLKQILPAFAVAHSSAPVALVSGHPEKAKKVAESYGINPENIYNYVNFDSIRDNPEIEIVYIVLPNSMHPEFTVRALKAGKHVLCEKPLAPTVAECQQMIDAAKSANKKLMTAYRLRYEPFNQKMIEFAREKKFGEIRTINAENIQNVKPPNIRLSRKLWGGPLGDVGVYCINACRYLTGEEPIEVAAMLTKPEDDPRFEEVEDRIIFQLRFPSGILANCTAGFSGNVTRRFDVVCEKGSFGLENAFAYTDLRAKTVDENGETELKIEATNHFAAEMDHFSECVQNDTEPTTPGEDGLRDIHIINKIYESVRERRSVSISG